MIFLLLCLLLFQLNPQPLRFIVFLPLLAAIAVGKLGLDDMSLALTADKREQARDDFFAKEGGPDSPEEIEQFYDAWDLKEFGVNSRNVPSLTNDQSA